MPKTYLDANGNPTSAPAGKVYLDPNTGEPTGSASPRVAGLPDGISLPGFPTRPSAPAGMLADDSIIHQQQNELDRGLATGVKSGLGERVIKHTAAAALAPIVHPANTAMGFIQSVGEGMGSSPYTAGMPGHFLSPLVDAEADSYKQGGAGAVAADLTGDALGGYAGGKVLGAIAEPTLGGAKAGIGKIQDLAVGDRDAAALRGLKVANGNKVLPTMDKVETARPYFQGADSLEDFQGRVKPAKQEVWAPYKQTIEAEGNNPVMGPDGPTTIGELEAERKQLSAMNRGLKTGAPDALELAKQKGLSQDQALQRESAIQAALDPELQKYGINPQEIRKTFGAVAQLGKQVAGRSTLLEKPTPTGFGKMSSFDITKPLQDVGKVGSGLRDLVAGRPMFSGSAMDMGIKEGFAKAGAKPNLGQYTPFKPMGMLNAPPIELGAPPEVGGVPEGYQPPPFYHDTTPMRTGRLLNAPPIQLGGEVHVPSQSTFRYDTTPMRKGNILPATLGEDIPLSSYADIFPDQIPAGTRVLPKIIDGKKLKPLVKE